MSNGVYNSRAFQMLILSPRFFRLVRLLLVFLALSASVVAADDFRTAEEQIARKIATVTGPGTIAIEFNNRTSVQKSNFETIRRQLLTELAVLGLRFVPAEQAAATVRFSLSEELQSYLWIAEINQGTNPSVVTMVASPRGGSALVDHPLAPMTLRKTPLWQQNLRILDAAVIDGNPSHLLVLDTEKIVAYRYQDGHWQPEQAFSIAHEHPWPRDVRGRLVLRRDHLLDAHLPGILCQSSSGKPVTLTCRASDDPWPLGAGQAGLTGFFANTRNYFTGALAGVGKQAMAPPFYSAAVLPREKYTLALFAGVDGKIHMLDGVTDLTSGNLGWGGNVASIHTSCGSGWQLLTSRDGLGSSDMVTAYEMPDREPVIVSQAIEFGGPVTELWTESEGSTAIAITRNSETGQYEAFRLSIACNQ